MGPPINDRNNSLASYILAISDIHITDIVW